MTCLGAERRADNTVTMATIHAMLAVLDGLAPLVPLRGDPGRTMEARAMRTPPCVDRPAKVDDFTNAGAATAPGRTGPLSLPGLFAHRQNIPRRGSHGMRSRRCHTHCSQALDLRRKVGRALWKTGLHLPARNRHLPLSGSRATDLALYHYRARAETQPLLVH